MNTTNARQTLILKTARVSASRLMVALLIAVAASAGTAAASEADETQAPELGRNGAPRALPPTLMDADAIAATTCQGSSRQSRLFIHDAGKQAGNRIDPATLKLVRNL